MPKKKKGGPKQGVPSEPSPPESSALSLHLPTNSSATSPSSSTSTSVSSPNPSSASNPDSVTSPERASLLKRLLDGNIPSNELAHLLQLRSFWPGFIGQVTVGSEQRGAPGAVCTVSQGLTHPDMPNRRYIGKEALNAKNERVIYLANKNPEKVISPREGCAGYGFEFAIWTKTRDHEVFDLFNHLVTELLLHDVDYLSLVINRPFVLIDRVVYGKQGGWPLMLSLAPDSSPLHGEHKLRNGSFRFIEVSVVTPEEHFALSCVPDSDVHKLLAAGPRGLTDVTRESVVKFDPKSHPTSVDHLRQAIFENDVAAVERWLAATVALHPAEFKNEALLEGVCYRDHPLVLACKNGKNPAIFSALIKAVPQLPVLRSRYRSSRAPSRLAHAFFEAITQDQPLIVKELLRADADLKVPVDVRCLIQQVFV